MKKIHIQEISTTGCANCAKAKTALEEIKKEFKQVEVEYIDMFSDEGQKLVIKNGIMSSPGITVNRKLFSSGGLDKNKLVKKIQELS